MILITSPQIHTDLLTFQKKKLYYNRISQNYLNLPLRFLADLWLLVQLTMHEHLRPIRHGFLIILLVSTFIALVSTQVGSSTLGISSSNTLTQQIPLQKEAKNISTPKDDTTTFYQFKIKNGKSYINPQEEVFRSIVYSKNRDKINNHNKLTDRKFNLALNKFADLTARQFSEIYTSTFKSDDRIKGYSKKLVELQNNLTSTLPITISPNYSFDNYTSDLNNLKDQISKQLTNKDSYLNNQNTEFSIVQQIFANALNTVNIKQNIQTDILNLLNELIANASKVQNTSTALLYLTLQNSLNQILLATNTLTNSPLKLTNDTTLMAATSTTTSTSSTGNFSSTAVDWTVHAGKIRYQGICGACYTFATSDAVASIYSIYKYGFVVPLSTQQVVDCSSNGLTYGCNGGFLQGSYAYIQIKGIQTDYNYPYTSATSGVAGVCKKDGGSFKISSFKNIEEGNCRALVNQLNYGPISIGIAGYRLQFYSEGIFNDCNNYIDHAVVLISYKGGVGWKIKNSWGTDWGMSGYAWIADGNNCGICNMAVSAKL